MTEISMPNWPQIPNAPGIVWREQHGRLECRWQARHDIIKRGWKPKSVLLWQGPSGKEPDEFERSYIADRAQTLQNDMLFWARSDEAPPQPVLDGSLADLCQKFLTDKHSPINKNKRYATKVHYRNVIRILQRDIGDMMLAELRGPDIIDYHERYLNLGKITMGSTLIGMLRMVVNFGCAILEDQECERLANRVLSKIRVQGGKARDSVLTFDQAKALIAAAHDSGFHSIALAQAFQFECTLRQKDVIGEWVPEAERGESYVMHHGKKWLWGIKWEEIDRDHVLHHITSKRSKLIEPDLKLAPLVIEEFKRFDIIPAKGPIVVCENTGRPWDVNSFRKFWRKMATKAGIPKTVRNMDSRAGAISEATAANVPLEKVRKAATHSDIQMTQRYSRSDQEAIAEVMRSRVASRTKGENGA